MLQDSIEQILAKRLGLVHRIRSAFSELAAVQPKRFKRGPFQLQVLETVEIGKTSANKRLVNEVARQLGYAEIAIRGARFYKRL